MSKPTNATPEPRPGDDNSVWVEGYCSPACIGQPVMFGKLASVELDHQYCLKSGYKEYPHIHEGPYKAKYIWDSTTPKALSDAAQSVRNTALAMGNEWMDKNNEFVERIVSLKWDRVLAIALYIEAFEAGVALKAQPARAHLAEDEALIVQAGRLAEREDYPPFKQVLRESASRLSLRSGQLARVLALCDERDLGPTLVINAREVLGLLRCILEDDQLQGGSDK